MMLCFYCMQLKKLKMEEEEKVASKAMSEQKCGLRRKKKSEPEGADLSPTRTVLTATKEVERLAEM